VVKITISNVASEKRKLDDLIISVNGLRTVKTFWSLNRI